MTERQCAVYARYSSEKQNSLTIEQQVRKCREYAERHGFTVLDAHIYTDEAISGATDNRAGLQRLLAAATQKPRAFDVILVDDTSRLSRNMIDSLKIFEQLRFVNVRTIFVAQGIDTESEQAELLVTTHGIVDSLYLKDLKARTFRGVEQRAIEGLHTGGRVFGYRHVPIENSNKRDAHGRPAIEGVRLEVEPAQAATIKRIFERYAAGHSMKRIAIDMNNEGILSPQPQKGRVSQSWCQSSIHHILHNERYRGVVIWGKPTSCARMKRESGFIGESSRVNGAARKFRLSGLSPTSCGRRCRGACGSCMICMARGQRTESAEGGQQALRTCSRGC
jgi:DNA invertase Pin-like site-specific DNA recombinase